MGLDIYAELEFQRRHLAEQTKPKDRQMVLAGINRLLDELIASPTIYRNNGEDYIEYPTEVGYGSE